MLRRVPTPLIALCAISALLGIAWALVTPPFQAPDENAHFSYTEYLSRTGKLPGDPLRPPFSTEQREAGLASNSDQVAGNAATDMSWNPADERAWQDREAKLREAEKRDSGGPVSASSNPPLYYLYAAIPARLTGGDNLFTRLAWERLATMLWGIALVVFSWLLAGEVFSRDRSLQFAAAGAAGMLPMVQFVTASVTPDAMLFSVWAAVFWVGAVVLRRGLTLGRASALLTLVGAACVVKATSYALLPPVLLVLVVGVYRLRHAGARVLLPLPAALLGLALTLGVWILVARHGHRAVAAQVTAVTTGGTPQTFHLHDFLGYLYQYYLPRLPGQGHYPFPSYFKGPPFFDVVLRGIFGTYGWTEVRLPGWLFGTLLGLTAAFVAAVGTALVRLRRRLDLPLLAFFVVAAVALAAGLQWTDYHQLRDSGYTAGFIQGRYFLPLAAIGGLAVALVLRMLPARTRPALAVGLVSALVVFNVYSLGLSAWRFYA